VPVTRKKCVGEGAEGAKGQEGTREVIIGRRKACPA
jgi:hypothetical protein